MVAARHKNKRKTLHQHSASIAAWIVLLVLAQAIDPSRSFVQNHPSLVVPLAVGSRLQANRIDKGFNLLEIASKVVPQGSIVRTAKESWGFLWKRFMVELAPQDQTGNYQRFIYLLWGTL